MLENLALQSSYIEFDLPGETLFKPGDAPKGFYWILEGEVIEKVSKDINVRMPKGSMVGLEEFLENRVHLSHWRTGGKTETLFIDIRCFSNFHKLGSSRDIISRELAHQLLLLKASCKNEAPDVLVKPA